MRLILQDFCDLWVKFSASRPRQRGRRILSRYLRGAKRRTTTRIKLAPGGKACGFLAAAHPLPRYAQKVNLDAHKK